MKVGLCCEVSWPSRIICFGEDRLSNLFKVLFILSFLMFWAGNVTRWHGKLSARHIAAFNLCFGPRHGGRTLRNMTSQANSSSSALVPRLEHRRKSSSLMSKFFRG